MVALKFVARSAAYCTAVSELGKKSTGQRILLIVTMGNLRKTVAAVYDRRRSRNREITGGHRPPLQLTLLLSGRRADRVSDDVTGNDHLDPAIPLPAGCSVVRSHGCALPKPFAVTRLELT